MIDAMNAISEEEKSHMLDYLCHHGQFLNQIEVFDNLWDELMQQPSQVGWLRLLRINLRRLRSAAILVEPLLPAEGQNWLQFLRATATELGNIREYDVAIKGCEKFEALMENEETAEAFALVMGGQFPTTLTALKGLLQQKRDVQCQMWLEHAKAGWIADGLSDLIAVLEQQQETSEASEIKAKAFLNTRLQNWGAKLCDKLATVSSASPMNEIHKLRIKIKRFRYSYDVFTRYKADMELLECLKAMQDILGYIRDRERNITVMEKLVLGKNDERLLQEFRSYKTWSEIEINAKLQGFDALRLELIAQLKLNLDI